MRQAPFIALVTPYGYVRAQRLADELEALGYEITIVDQPTRAGRALDADACVIVLTPDDWRDPAIVEVMRGRPPVLIPVLAAPMDPPRASWASKPIPMRGAARDVAEAVADAVDDALNNGSSGTWSRSGSGGGRGDQRSASYGRGPTSSSRPRGNGSYGNSSSREMSRPYPRVADRPAMNAFGQPIQPLTTVKKKKGGSAGRTVAILGVILVVLGGVGFAGYHYRYKLFPQHPAAPVTMSAYSAAIPGTGCDKGKGVWQLRTDHSYYTTACEADGLQVTQSTKLGTTPAEVDFTGTGPKFPLSYHLFMTATITGGDQHTWVALVVHGQSPLGGHVFRAAADTSWGFQVMGNDGALAPALRRGFSTQATKTLKLEVDVSGSVMTFIVNGTQVTHLYENTYTSTNDVGLLLGTDNATEKTALVAKFSQFQFTPEPDPTLSDSDAIATAEAANAAIPNPYTASVPGPGCDKGGAQWATPAYYDQPKTDITFACQSSALQLVATTGNAGNVGYYGVKGVIKGNYALTVTMTPANGISCAGIATHVETQGGYLYVICGNGAYIVYKYNASTNATTQLDSGSVGNLNSAGAYVLNITENGTSHVLKVNGTTISTTSDKTYTDTDHIELGAIATSNGPATVSYASFSFNSL